MTELKHIYLNTPLQQGVVTLPKEVAHRLGKVLRLSAGHEVALFNGKDGLWRARLDDPKAGIATCITLLRPQTEVQGPTLLLACLKRDAFETTLRQATELGVVMIQPLITEFTIKNDFNPARALAIVTEAAEQCERLTLPEVCGVVTLKEAVLYRSKIYWAAEREVASVWPATLDRDAAVLVGPEGGFSENEKTWLKQQGNVVPVSLGQSILRADTAVVAVLSQLLRP